jgi:hypothetical protein
MRRSFSQQAPDRRPLKDTRDGFLELLNRSCGSRTDRVVSSGMHRWFLVPLIAESEPVFELVRLRRLDLALVL